MEIAGEIGAIYGTVAVVVRTVVADLGRALGARGREQAVGIGAVDKSITVVICPVVTHFRDARLDADTRAAPGAIGVQTVHEQIAVVVGSVRAVFGLCLTATQRGITAIRVRTIALSVAIVVHAVVTAIHFVQRAAAR
jgi:hypothetical protein